MANTIYTVVKDGTELKELKTLAAAKKLADAEGAEVYADGECVYSPVSTTLSDPAIPSAEDNVDAKEAEETKVEDMPQAEKYRLLHTMNVRKAPSLKAEKVGVLDKGAVVEVEKKVDDWLHLTDGTFILYGDGKFASKLLTNA